MLTKSRILQELPRLFGFCIVGGGGFFVHAISLYILSNGFGQNKILSWFPAFLVAVCFTWLANRALTFRGLSQFPAKREATRYLLIQSLGACINFTVYAGVVSGPITMFTQPVIALIFGAAAAFLFNYFMLRIFVFGGDVDALIPNQDLDVDEIYYEHAMSLPLARRMTYYARKRMFNHFMSVMQPGPDTKILDFGASEVENHEANMLEKSYPYKNQITCAGLGDGSQIKQAHPQVEYVKIEAGEALPFADNSFDIAYSNAVFEHVGSDETREFLIKELSRVAKRVYITTPNRWFPIEHHTAIPILHFWPHLFRTFTKDGKFAHWALPQNLQFLSRNDLKSVFSKSPKKGTGAYTGVKIGPFSSNITYWTQA